MQRNATEYYRAHRETNPPDSPWEVFSPRCAKLIQSSDSRLAFNRTGDYFEGEMMNAPTLTVPVPHAVGPIPANDKSYPFSTMRFAREPLDLATYGYVEEEYFLSGTANIYGFAPEDNSCVVVEKEGIPYCTRVLVRRPAEESSPTAWVSILNASQGYDIEDDWRQAWDYLMSKRHTYVAVTAKPIQISALQTFDPERYGKLSWGGKPRQIDAAEPGWNPFMQLDECEEGLAWDVIAQVSAWLRSSDSPVELEHVFLIGQSQSSVYANTYLTYFHNLLRLTDGAPTYDGYAPGVGSVFVKAINQHKSGIPPQMLSGVDLEAPGTEEKQAAFVPYLVEPAQLDVPIISTSSEADVSLFGAGPDSFHLGDGPLRRHWHVTRSPHSDARSRVIPQNSEVVKAKRRPRQIDTAFLESLSALPIEPIITGSMAAVEKWAAEGAPAAPSTWFDADGNRWIKDSDGMLSGGVELGIVAHPIADFLPGEPSNPVYGLMTLHSRESILGRFASFEDYQATCDEVDDALEATGYLEPVGRRLLHAVERELWERAVNGAPAPLSSPQGR
ncbi:alpha/beta hydrolase domain-containing protein [Actinotignum sp. GS-2025e]|uniref:alpha/beta hydrolase domain-containing protein n=1 Tax=Actinotignum sp. GS-2025e TaxID=3427278 RepID=UPI003F48D765